MENKCREPERERLLRNDGQRSEVAAEQENVNREPKGAAEQQRRSKELEKVAIGIALMFGVYWLYAYYLQDVLELSASVEKVLGLVSLYVVGLGLFVLVTKGTSGSRGERDSGSGERQDGLRENAGISSSQRERGRVRECQQEPGTLPRKQFVLCFLLQFSAIMIMSVLVNVLGALGIEVVTTEIDTVSPYMLFMLLIFNPIAEEFVFRKLFADKLLKYGERFYVFASAFCFAIVHGVSLGIPQVIYTFVLGLVWGYVMAKTGDFKLVVLLHALSNLFGGVLLQLLMSIAMPLAGVYSIMLMATGAVGLSIFMANRKKVVLDGELGLFKGAVLKSIFANRGVWMYIVLTIVVMIVK